LQTRLHGAELMSCNGRLIGHSALGGKEVSPCAEFLIVTPLTAEQQPYLVVLNRVGLSAVYLCRFFWDAIPCYDPAPCRAATLRRRPRRASSAPLAQEAEGFSGLTTA
jgi:hypothetical protein